MTAKQQFRITSIQLDPDENVAAVHAMATAAAYEVITGMLTGERVQAGEPGPDGRRLVTLLRPAADRLRSLTGSIRGTDPQYPVTTEIWDSMCLVQALTGEDW
jgi:hypothetical protein